MTVRLLFCVLLIPLMAYGEQSSQSAWIGLEADEKQTVMNFADAYARFIAEARTELSTVRKVVEIVRREGFRPLNQESELQPGQRWYAVNRDRMMCVIVTGSRPLRSGIRIIGSHIDSPRLELKANPVYAREKYGLFQTNYHGGIKRYQWVNVPLGLEGRVDTKDGRTISIRIGFQPEDPVFIIADLAPHVDKDYRDRKAPDAIHYEELDPLAAHIPLNGSLEEQILSYFQKRYGISESDFVSAELALVPVMEPRSVGVDEGLMAAYGNDDRLCSYAALRASLAVARPPFTTITYLTDNEESGSNNNTGARSDFLRRIIGELLRMDGGGSIIDVQRALESVEVISGDVTTGVHPVWPGVQESANAARLGYGVAIKRYGRGNDPNSEFTAKIRRIMDENQVSWQTHTYKVGVGGGGTIGGFMSMENMEVLDLGIPLLSMHSTYSIFSKVDLYLLYTFLTGFYRDTQAPTRSFDLQPVEN